MREFGDRFDFAQLFPCALFHSQALPALQRCCIVSSRHEIMASCRLPGRYPLHFYSDLCCPLYTLISYFPTNVLKPIPLFGIFYADVAKNPELLKKLASLVDDGDDFDCPICLSPPTKTGITSCTHIYCQTCISRAPVHVAQYAGAPYLRRTSFSPQR
jgi:hypothetical protein